MSEITRKKPCICTRTELGDLSFIKWHGRCTICNDKKEVDEYPQAYKLHLKYKSVNWKKIEEEYSEHEIRFICECGNSVFIMDEPATCTCGRVYNLVFNLQVNEDYLNRQDELWKAVDELNE